MGHFDDAVSAIIDGSTFYAPFQKTLSSALGLRLRYKV